MKNLRIILGLFVLTLLTAFTTNQMNQEDELIIGTWIPCDSNQTEPIECVESNENYMNRLIFYSNGTMEDYLENDVYKVNTWEIEEKQSQKGKLMFSFLKLTNSNDPNDTYEYKIIGLGKEKMRLAYFNGVGISYSTYYRQ